MYIGLDLSTTNSGVVILNEDVEFKLFSHKSKDIYERSEVIIQDIKKYLLPIKSKIKGACIESPAYMAKGKVAELSMLTGAVYYFLRENNVKVALIPPSKLKKHFCGNGRASKEEMIAAAPKELVTIFKKEYKKVDDLVDAYGLAKMAKEIS